MPMLPGFGVGECIGLLVSLTRSLSGYTIPIFVEARCEAFDFSVLAFDTDVVLLLLRKNSILILLIS